MTMPRLLKEVVDELELCPEVEAILLAGSRGKGLVPDARSDWDLYLYTTGPLAPEVRKRILFSRSSVLELGNTFWETEDDGELNDGTAYELIYRSLDDLVAQLSSVVENHGASTGYSTCFWHNFQTSHILFDRTGQATAAQKRFDVPYPRELQNAIVAKNWPLLQLALPNYRSQVAKALGRGDWISVFHRTSAYLASAIDIVFAVNGVAHPGEKRLAELSGLLPLLPSDWKGLLAGVDRALSGSRTALPEALDRLSSAIRVFLERQGYLEPMPAKKPPMVSRETPSVQPAAPVIPSTSPLIVFTDGGCIGNPGKGAWAYLVDDGVSRMEDTDGDPLTTNNKMELQAVIEALSAISAKTDWKGRAIRIHTDSQYVRNGITAWIKTWSANGWKTASKEPVKNKELWIELQKWDQALHPEWKWVKGHAGNANNERCDQLVRRTMEQMG